MYFINIVKLIQRTVPVVIDLLKNGSQMGKSDLFGVNQPINKSLPPTLSDINSFL